MNGHSMIFEDLGKWGFGRKFRTRCLCRLWSSTVEDNRPDVIRQYSIHAMNTGHELAWGRK